MTPQEVPWLSEKAQKDRPDFCFNFLLICLIGFDCWAKACSAQGFLLSQYSGITLGSAHVTILPVDHFLAVNPEPASGWKGMQACGPGQQGKALPSIHLTTIHNHSGLNN